MRFHLAANKVVLPSLSLVEVTALLQEDCYIACSSWCYWLLIRSVYNFSFSLDFHFPCLTLYSELVHYEVYCSNPVLTFHCQLAVIGQYYCCHFSQCRKYAITPIRMFTQSYLCALSCWQTWFRILKREKHVKKPAGWSFWNNWHGCSVTSFCRVRNKMVIKFCSCSLVGLINPLGYILHSLMLNIISFHGVRVDIYLIDWKLKQITMAWLGIEFNLLTITSKNPVPSPHFSISYLI